MRVRVLGETHGRRVEGVEVLRHLCMCITRLCASIVLRCRCPTGCVPPPTSSTPYVERRLRHVDALLPCANPCARTSACLPRRALRALLLLREFDSPFYLCAQPVHRHVVSQPCAALWRLGLEQLAALRAPPSTKVCGNCILVCLARPPSPVHSFAPLVYIDTKPHHPPSSVPMRCPSSMHCCVMPPSFATSRALLCRRAGES